MTERPPSARVPIVEKLGKCCVSQSKQCESRGDELGVTTSTVPFTGEGLRVEGDLDSPLLSDSNEQESSHPEVVAHVDSGTRSNLELPLTRHDLGVDTGDGDTSVETSSVMRFNHISSVDSSSSYNWRISFLVVAN